ncbi:hypothetical protein KIN20_000275 [Parelaphostrongylus tenuis]|uniref:Uncharacterized protein n=1 Tax=Parelaphostrongylus tenuis TaxID=148309 RepID=A0AAD5QFX1_PARTN|nr:hypothetical protein KIN20_000275 [Parelaphostrongylus tenuis]
MMWNHTCNLGSGIEVCPNKTNAVCYESPPQDKIQTHGEAPPTALIGALTLLPLVACQTMGRNYVVAKADHFGPFNRKFNMGLKQRKLLATSTMHSVQELLRNVQCSGGSKSFVKEPRAL